METDAAVKSAETVKTITIQPIVRPENDSAFADITITAANPIQIQ